MRLAVALPFLTLSACATPSDRIADALMAYGIAPSQAQCVGERLEDRLSVGQLQELAQYARAYRDDDSRPDTLDVTDLIRVASQVHDARVPVELGKAAANCGLLSPRAAGLFRAFLSV